MIWLIDHIQSRIDNAIHKSEYVESFNITFGLEGNIDGPDVLNELLGRILMQDIHPDGFK